MTNPRKARLAARVRQLPRGDRASLYAIWAERLRDIYRPFVSDARLDLMGAAIDTLAATGVSHDLAALAKRWRTESTLQGKSPDGGLAAASVCYFFDYAIAELRDEQYLAAAAQYVRPAVMYLVPSGRTSTAGSLNVVRGFSPGLSDDTVPLQIAKELEFQECTLTFTEQVVARGEAVNIAGLRESCWGDGPEIFSH